MAVKSKPRTTKKAQLIRMLSTKAGADVGMISAKLSWQSHTTRAAITMLKKAGYEVTVEKQTGKPTRYRIAAAPQDVQDVGGETVVGESIPATEPSDAG